MESKEGDQSHQKQIAAVSEWLQHIVQACGIVSYEM